MDFDFGGFIVVLTRTALRRSARFIAHPIVEICTPSGVRCDFSRDLRIDGTFFTVSKERFEFILLNHVADYLFETRTADFID